LFSEAGDLRHFELIDADRRLSGFSTLTDVAGSA
jgi:hypothetical protein